VRIASRADSGSGTCLGYDIRTQSGEIKRHVGYRTQRFSFWEDLSIRENLDFIARVYAMPSRREAVDRSIEGPAAWRALRQLAGSLSGGWEAAPRARRVHAPPARVAAPRRAHRRRGSEREARISGRRLHALAARGISILVSTHYMDEAERCHKLAYIAYGKVMAQGTAQEIIDAQGLATWEVTGGDLTRSPRACAASPAWSRSPRSARACT
jgi:ABC-2 type transport system ATP-binding protein